MTYVLVALLYAGNWGGPVNLGDFASRGACQSAGEAFRLEAKGVGYDQSAFRSVEYLCVPADRQAR